MEEILEEIKMEELPVEETENIELPYENMEELSNNKGEDEEEVEENE